MFATPVSADPPRRHPLRSQAVQVTLGLVLGLALGMWLSQSASPSTFTRGLLAVLDVVGTAWINAVRMTVIPLVVPLLIVGVAGGGDTSVTGRVGAKAFAWMLGLAIACAIFSAAVSPLWFDTLVLDPEATARLRATASIDIPSADALSLRTFILGLIPLNPIKAAADGTLLPVVLFTLLYAFALGQVTEGPRAAQLAFFRELFDIRLARPCADIPLHRPHIIPRLIQANPVKGRTAPLKSRSIRANQCAIVQSPRA